MLRTLMMKEYYNLIRQRCAFFDQGISLNFLQVLFDSHYFSCLLIEFELSKFGPVCLIRLLLIAWLVLWDNIVPWLLYSLQQLHLLLLAWLTLHHRHELLAWLSLKLLWLNHHVVLLSQNRTLTLHVRNHRCCLPLPSHLLRLIVFHILECFPLLVIKGAHYVAGYLKNYNN